MAPDLPLPKDAPRAMSDPASDNPYAPPASTPAVAEGAPAPARGPSGLGGWLTVVGLTLVVGAVMRCMVIVQNNTIPTAQWEALTTPGSPSYDPWWEPAIHAETLMAAGLIAMIAWLLVLFFRKQRRFITIFMAFAGASVLVALIDLILCGQIRNFPPAIITQSWKVLGQSLIYAAIWCSYLRKSVRVRNTFTRGA
jgi:hypothetical protein